MRYIDADKIDYTVTMVGRDENAGYQTMALKNDIDEMPTADVVPKSEVEEAEAEIERLKHILDCYALQYGTVKEQQDVIDKANQEVAREIFEEIEMIMLDGEIGGKYAAKVINPDKYAELKKKYTEGLNDGNA